VKIPDSELTRVPAQAPQAGQNRLIFRPVLLGLQLPPTRLRIRNFEPNLKNLKECTTSRGSTQNVRLPTSVGGGVRVASDGFGKPEKTSSQRYRVPTRDHLTADFGTDEVLFPMTIRHAEATAQVCWELSKGPKLWEVLCGETKAANTGPKSASSLPEDLHAVAMEVTRCLAVAESRRSTRDCRTNAQLSAEIEHLRHQLALALGHSRRRSASGP
jgi:hypothetical protein